MTVVTPATRLAGVGGGDPLRHMLGMGPRDGWADGTDR